MLKRGSLVAALLLLALAAPVALGARPQGARSPATDAIAPPPAAARHLLQANASGGGDTCAAEREAGMKNVEPQSGLCACQEGWIGPACDVCVTDQACGANQLCLDSPAIGKTDCEPRSFPFSLSLPFRFPRSSFNDTDLLSRDLSLSSIFAPTRDCSQDLLLPS